MVYPEQRWVANHQVSSLAPTLLARVISRARVTGLTLASVAGAAGCVAGCATDSPSTGAERDLLDVRCRIAMPDGSCESMPANCPVTLPPSIEPREPHCPLGAELIPIAADHCATKLICID